MKTPAKKLQWRFTQNGLQKGFSPRTWWEALSQARDASGQPFRWRIQCLGSARYCSRLSDYPLASFQAPATAARRLGLAMNNCQDREDRLIEVLNRCRIEQTQEVATA